MAIMQSTNTRCDDITVSEAYAILVAYYVNSSVGSFEISSSLWEEVISLVIKIEFDAQSNNEISIDRAKELAKRCNILFADILKKQAGLT